MRNKRIVSIFGSPYEKYFENGSPDPAGDLLGGGIGLPTHRNDWWDIRELWTYPYYNLNMMLGDGIGSYRNEKGFQCELSPGSFFFTFPDLKHQYGPAKDEHWGEIYVSFAGELFELVRKQQILNPSQPVWKSGNLTPWVNRLQQVLQTPGPVTKRQTMHRAARFLEYLLELLEEAEPVQAAKPDGDWFVVACEMLTCDLHHKVDWRQIAGNLGMSYHTFRLYFTQRAGISPTRYRNKVRIETACEHLTNDVHKPCKEIAFNLGFTGPQHFSEQFKKHIGLSPHEYRKTHLKKSGVGRKRTSG